MATLSATFPQALRWCGARWLGCVLLLAPIPLLALDPAKSIFQFNCRNWTRQSGLPSDKVSTIAQSADGYIWLGTQNGLVRFDGLDFTSVAIDLPEARGQDVRKLIPARAGGLWFAINNGGSGHFDGVRFTRIGDPRWARPDMKTTTILEDRGGDIWLGANLAWGRWNRTAARAPLFEEVSSTVLQLAEDPDGVIWMGTAERGLFRVRGNALEPFPDATLQAENIYAIAVDRAGRRWVGTGRGLRCYRPDGQRHETYFREAQINALLVDRQGILWIGTNRLGLIRMTDRETAFLQKTSGLGSDHVLSLFEDAEGSLWVGTQDGLSQLTDIKFPIVSALEGLNEGGGIAVAPSRRGGLWIATPMGATYFDGVAATNYTSPGVLPNNYIRRIWEARNGDVYLGDGDKSVLVLRDGAVVERHVLRRWPDALGEDAESVLAAIGPDVHRFRGGKLEPLEFTGAAPDTRWINNLMTAADGAIWVASNNGVFRIAHGTFQQWSTREGLSSDRIHFLLEDFDGSVWAGMPTGLARISRGEVRNIPRDAGLHNEKVYAIVPDDHGWFWIASGRGFYRVRRQALNAYADGLARHVACEAFDGLDAVKFTDRTEQASSGCRTRDGRIWFPNPGGVVVIDPNNIWTNRVAPPVHIERLLVNGAARAPAPRTLLAVGDRNLEFQFSALSYISPRKVQMRYQLVGADHDWVSAGTRRSAVYSNLPAGPYRFRVQAANADGVWNPQPAEIALELPPPFYATVWFFGLCLAGGAGSIFAGYRWKVRHMRLLQRRLEAQNDALEAKVAERTAELAHEHALLRALLDSSPDQIYFKDADARYLKASQARAEWLGAASADAVVGRRDADFRPLEEGQQALRDEQEIIRTGQPVIGKVEHALGRDQAERWLLTSKMPLRNKAGQIVGTFGLSKEITALKRAEERLTEVHKQLLESSRRAGMAEVATSVLHNVGNVLNSVNVSSTLAAERVREFKIGYLGKVSAMLRAHAGQEHALLTEDPRGQKLPAFVDTLAEQLATEQQAILQELGQLDRDVEHIKQIVAMQQSYARVAGVTETLPLSQIVEDAAHMNSGALLRHDVELVRDYQADPLVTTERHKVLQILVNVLRNAKYACDETGRPDKRIVLRITQDEQWARVSVIDNGIGIPAEQLTRVFGFGFTTKKDGHGFALHSGALVATELGGALRVESGGAGQGATFILELPLAAVEPASAPHGQSAPASPNPPA